MNEVTKIHLGRQPFTISVDAYKELQDYLHSIRHQAGSKDVVDEVELRMAELLVEHGVTGEKVIIAEDITYLRQQLGEPGDFKDDSKDGKDEGPDEESASIKRLYRDTEHGMVAGVAAGIAAYFGIDVAIVRVLFVLAIVTGGWGFLLYIALWLIVPEAKSPSERLQMHGKAVTVDSLKEVIERADVQGAAKRAGNVVGGAVGTILKVLLAIVGIGLAMGGIATMLSTVTAGTYLIVHGSLVNSQAVFPVGIQQVVVAVSGIMLAAIIGLFLLVSGMSLVRRKWVLPGWATAVLLTIFFVVVGVGTALSIDAVPHIRDRIKDAKQTQVNAMCESGVLSWCSNDAYYR